MNMDSIYQYSALTSRGEVLDFDSLRGKVILIVNTASKCGFTPQLQALEDLYQEYKDQGLEVIGFPCNQFGHQEPGSNEEIQTFCSINYGVRFRIMQKIEVNGKGTHPVYAYLKRSAPGFLTNGIKWNFTKFLISRDGSHIERFAPITKPEKLRPAIEKLLAE